MQDILTQDSQNAHGPLLGIPAWQRDGHKHTSILSLGFQFMP